MKQLEWDSADASALRVFLETESGKKLPLYMAFLRPSFEDGENPTKTICRAGEIKGFELAVETLQLLTESRVIDGVIAGEDAYPSIDDEDKWVSPSA